MKKRLLLAFLLSFVFPSLCFSLERFEIITTSEMQQLLDDRKNEKIDFLLVNALDEMIYRHSSIPGSISIPLNAFKQYAERLGDDPGKLIIPY